MSRQKITSKAKKRSRNPRCAASSSPKNSLNYVKALDTMEGDKDLLKRLMILFLEDYPRQIEILRQAVSSRNYETIRIHAHNLKGSSSFISAEAARQASLELEKTALENRLECAPERLQELEKELKKLDLEIRETLLRI